MKEKYVDISNTEHYILLSKIFTKIETLKINNILDAGSGKTSLSILLKCFPNSNIDAIVYYNDKRKMHSIKENIISNRFNLVEKDICKDNISKKYELVLAHLLLGEATKWGNTFTDLLENLSKIDSKYFAILDLKEDPSVDYNYLEQFIENNSFKIIVKDEINKKEEQQFNGFIGKTYVAYLIEKQKKQKTVRTKIFNSLLSTCQVKTHSKRSDNIYLGGNFMKFKEFENPEQKDYDIKVGTKVPTFTPPSNNDAALNIDEGIDLNALDDETFSMPQVSADNGNFTINEFGEIVRDIPVTPTSGEFTKTTEDLVDEPKGKSR